MVEGHAAELDLGRCVGALCHEARPRLHLWAGGVSLESGGGGVTALVEVADDDNVLDAGQEADDLACALGHVVLLAAVPVRVDGEEHARLDDVVAVDDGLDAELGGRGGEDSADWGLAGLEQNIVVALLAVMQPSL